MMKKIIPFILSATLILVSCGQENIKAKLEAAKSHYNRGCDYSKKSERDKALSEFNKAIEIDPRYAEAYYERGFIYYTQGGIYGGKSLEGGDKGLKDQATANFTKAIADFTKAIEINPGYVEAYFHRRTAYMVTKQPDLAISDCNKLIEIDPENAYNHYVMRGAFHNGKGQYNKAIFDYNKAIEIDPTNDSAYAFKALACEKTGRISEANEAWEKMMRYHKEQ